MASRQGKAQGSSWRVTATEAYRGYLLTWLPFTEQYSVSKDDHHVCYSSTLADAKRTIDALLD